MKDATVEELFNMMNP